MTALFTEDRVLSDLPFSLVPGGEGLILSILVGDDDGVEVPLLEIFESGGQVFVVYAFPRRCFLFVGSASILLSNEKMPLRKGDKLHVLCECVERKGSFQVAIEH